MWGGVESLLRSEIQNVKEMNNSYIKFLWAVLPTAARGLLSACMHVIDD